LEGRRGRWAGERLEEGDRKANREQGEAVEEAGTPM
jgi:hypothetical protein